MHADIKDESVLSMLEMVHPKLEHQHTLARQFNLIQGLKVVGNSQASAIAVVLHL